MGNKLENDDLLKNVTGGSYTILKDSWYLYNNDAGTKIIYVVLNDGQFCGQYEGNNYVATSEYDYNPVTNKYHLVHNGASDVNAYFLSMCKLITDSEKSQYILVD